MKNNEAFKESFWHRYQGQSYDSSIQPQKRKHNTFNMSMYIQAITSMKIIISIKKVTNKILSMIYTYMIHNIKHKHNVEVLAYI